MPGDVLGPGQRQSLRHEGRPVARNCPDIRVLIKASFTEQTAEPK